MINDPTRGDKTAHEYPKKFYRMKRTLLWRLLRRIDMSKERIDIGGEVFGPYSSGVKANGIIWLSGQISLDSGESAAEQTLGCLIKIDSLLEAAGASKHDICFAQVLLDDINDYTEMNEVYGNWLKDVEIAPARAAFEAANLPKGAKVEIVIQAISPE